MQKTPERDYDSGKRIRGDINTDFDDRREQLIEELTDAHNALNLFDRHQGTSNYTHVLNQRQSSGIEGMGMSGADANVIDKFRNRKQLQTGRESGQFQGSTDKYTRNLKEELSLVHEDHENKMKKITREHTEELNRIKVANDKLITEFKTQIHENKKKYNLSRKKQRSSKKN